MRRKLTYLLLSLFLLAGTSLSYASEGDHHGGKGHQEQGNHRGHGKNDNGNKGFNHGNNRKNSADRPGQSKDKKDKHFNNKGNKNNGHHNKPGNRPGNSFARPGNNSHYAPKPVNRPHKAPAPRPLPAPGYRPGSSGFHYGPALPPPPPRLPYMVEYITRGCNNVDVWRVSDEEFIVKYRRGNRWFTQYVYPYKEVYGNPTLISVNWQPLSPWTLIPPIQLNINL